jgi:hypothetical protein
MRSDGHRILKQWETVHISRLTDYQEPGSGTDPLLALLRCVVVLT